MSHVKKIFYLLIFLCLVLLVIEPVMAQEQPVVSYDELSKTIIIEAGTCTLQDIVNKTDDSLMRNQVSNVYVVNSNIHISTNAELVLIDEVLKMNCSFDGEYVITNNGKLTIFSSYITTVGEEHHSYIDSFNAPYVANGWSFTMIDSKVSNMGSNLIGKSAITLGHPASYEGNSPASPVFIQNSTLENCEFAFLRFSTFGTIPGNYFTINGNHFSGISSTQSGNNALITVPSYSNFTNNRIENVTTGGYVYWTSGQFDILIQGNEFYNCSGLVLIDSKHSNNITIKDNLMSGNYGTGIRVYKGWVDGYELGDVVINNTIENHTGNYAFQIQYDSATANIVKNNILKNISGNALLFMGANSTVFEGNQINNCTGAGIVFASTTYREVYMENNDLVFKNNEIEDCYKSLIFMHSVDNFISINDIYCNIEAGMSLAKNSSISFINLDSDGEIVFSEGSVYHDFRYLDTKVVDVNGEPLENVNVFVQNNVEGVNDSINLCGDVITVASTDYTGHIPLPFEKNESIAILDFRDNENEIEEMMYTLVIEKDGVTNLLSINPDSTWYREDPDIPTYTITAVITAESSTSPQMIGFAPSEGNPSETGESKKFSLWTDEDLTAKEWYVDDVLVSTGSMEYTWSIKEGSHAIVFAGSNDNGAVSQTWVIEDGLIVSVECPSEESVEEPVLSGGDTSFTPAATSITADVGNSTTFSITSDQPFMSMNWYVDEELVESGTMSYTQEWISDGSHTIRLEGDTGLDVVTNTWDVFVTPMNHAPVLNSIGNRTVNTGSELSFKVSASDADVDALNYSASGMPEGAIFDSASGSFSWIPAASQAGSYTITFEVTDGRAVDSETISITVNAENVSQEQSVIYDNRLREGSPDTILGESTYVDIGNINGVGSYRDVIWFDLSDYNTTDEVSSATLSLYWYYPASTTRGSDTVVEIYRPAEWNPEYVSWNNRDQNTPWNNAGGDWFDMNAAAQGNATYATITFSASDLPDNGYHDFDVTELVQNYISGKYNNTGFFLKARDESDNYIAFYSSDWENQNQRPKLEISTTVLSNTAPEFAYIAAVSVEEKDTISFTVNATDPDGDELAYSCTFLPEGASFDTAMATFRWTPQEDEAGSYEVVFEVTDGYLNDSASVTITVNPLSDAPVTPEEPVPDDEPSYTPSSTSLTTEVGESTVFTVSFDESFISCDWYLDGQLVESSTTSHMQEWVSSGIHTVKFLGAAESGVFSRTWTVDVPDTHPRWDVNEDGVVNILDITLVGQNYGQTYSDTLPRWDVNEDGTIDAEDISIVQEHFGETVE